MNVKRIARSAGGKIREGETQLVPSFNSIEIQVFCVL